MKRIKSVIIFLIISILCVFAVVFSGCELFEYKSGPTQQEVESIEELKRQKDSYINKLNGLSDGDKYYEEERDVYVLSLLEGVNELNECESVHELELVYEKHSAIIKSIKTIAEYVAEEEQRQAELDCAKSDFTERLNSISSEENYREKEKAEYLFYLESGLKEISGCEDKDLLENIFNAYRDAILSVKTAKEYEAEELAAFVAYKNENLAVISSYVDVKEYREAEALLIDIFIDEYSSAISSVEYNPDKCYEQVDNLVREFKIKIYPLKTDKELYQEELDSLISLSITEIRDYVNIENYRINEALIVNSVIQSFNNQVVKLQRLELVKETVTAYKNILDSIKTDAVLYEEEKLVLINAGYERLLSVVNFDNMSEENVAAYLEYCGGVRDRLLVLKTKEEVNDLISAELKNAYSEGAKLNDPNALANYKEILISDLNNIYALNLYREEQGRQVHSLISKWEKSINAAANYEETVSQFENAVAELDDVPTNDRLWKIEDDEFRDRLKELYGSTVLDEPRSLSEANDYNELAAIIDYYAFYQIDGASFVRDKFRVKLNWEHKDAVWERNEVYWYCELLKSAVDISTEFDGNSDNLIITLIPYNFASISNASETTKMVRESSNVEFKSDKSGFISRAEDFDDFPYYKYGKSVTVWNSQQLWYALEHGYIPDCVENSSADIILKKAKAILRQIIKEGMSDEEKIFNIYKWFGDNVQYDHLHVRYDKSSDRNNFPNEIISAVQSHFIEGVLNDGLAVCIGYAKTYLLMLRIEGINAKFNLARMPYMTENTISSIAGGFHGYVIIEIGGVWYYSDPQKTFAGADEDLISFAYISLPRMTSPFREVMNIDLPSENNLDYYNNLSFNELNVFIQDKNELYNFLQTFDLSAETRISVYYDKNSYKYCYDHLLEYDTNYDVVHISGDGYIEELVIMKVSS